MPNQSSELSAETKKKAYSYRRFSNEKQAAGDSLRRQLSEAQDYCRRNGLELDETLEADKGVSAFKGRNSKEGNLGLFIRAVEDGLVESGSFLIVENLDRMSRIEPGRAYNLLQRICDLGINVVTTNDNKVYTQDNIHSDMVSMIGSIMRFSVANEESKKKSVRVKAAWVHRKQKAVDDGYVVKEMYPHWITCPNEDQPYLDEERSFTVKRIVTEYLSGKGINTIVRNLNEDGVKTFGGGKQWWQDTVRQILDNPAIAGLYKDRENYFPAIITIEQWNDLRTLRNSQHRPKVRGKALLNPLSGLAFCPECGGILTRVEKGLRGKAKLVCLSQKMKKVDHQYYAVNLDDALEKVLKYLPIIMDEQPSGDPAIDEDIFSMGNDIVGCQQQIERLVELAAEGIDNASVGLKIRTLEAQQKEMVSELAELQEQAQVASPVNQRRRRDELLEAIGHVTEIDPAELNYKLRMVLKGIVINRDGGIREWNFN
jgi:DNA invertase Pin-like site-specific DNA recombinase